MTLTKRQWQNMMIERQINKNQCVNKATYGIIKSKDKNRNKDYMRENYGVVADATTWVCNTSAWKALGESRNG